MGSQLEVFFLIVAILAAAGVYGVISGRISSHGFLILAWRWLTGHPWHGREVTDAGWFRPATKALTRTGHAPRFHHRPRWQRTASRSGRALALVLFLLGLMDNPRLTIILTLAAIVVLIGAGIARGVVLVRRHRHHRTWVQPLHNAIAPLVGHAIANKPGSWLKVEQDRSKAVLAVPQGFNAPANEQAKIAGGVAAKLGMESPEVRWRLAGPEPTLTLTASHPPPALVRWEDEGSERIRQAVEKAGQDELVLGIGKQDSIVTVSLRNDSPHFGISMGTGGGKSTLAAFILMQELSRGAIALVLDAKLISHPWLRGLPNVAYARTAAELHAAMCWLGGELDRRNQVALNSVDVRGTVHANVGPRLFIIAEELNLAMPRLRRYWTDIRDPEDPKLSPAIASLGDVAFAGRQVRMHLLLIGQMLSAKATGGGEVRENVGVRILSRYSANAWKMMCPEIVMPPSPSNLGRMQVAVAGKARETQVPLIDLATARNIVLAGKVTPCPAGMPCAVAVTGAPQIENPWPEQPIVTVTPAPVTGADGVSLREALNLKIVPGTIHSLRQARHRDKENFPAVVGHRSLEHLYDPLELSGYFAERP